MTRFVEQILFSLLHILYNNLSVYKIFPLSQQLYCWICSKPSCCLCVVFSAVFISCITGVLLSIYTAVEVCIRNLTVTKICEPPAFLFKCRQSCICQWGMGGVTHAQNVADPIQEPKTSFEVDYSGHQSSVEETYFWVRNAVFWRRNCSYSMGNL